MALFNLERYEEAAAEFQAYRAARPASFTSATFLTAIFAQLDRQEEMQVERDKWFAGVQKRFGVDPTISGTLSFYRFAKPEDQERLASALRKAGLEE